MEVPIHVLERLRIHYFQDWEECLVLILGFIAGLGASSLVLLVRLLSLVEHLIPKEAAATKRPVQLPLLDLVGINAKLEGS